MRTYRFPNKTGYPPILQNDILVLKPMVLRILHFKKPPNMGVSYTSDIFGPYGIPNPTPLRDRAMGE